jgi:excisionase family DNA binding protein
MMPADDAMPPRRMMTIAEVAEYLQVHPSTIYRLVHKGQIPAFKIGSDYRFDRMQSKSGWPTDR